MAMQDLDLLAKYGIKIKTIADRMGVSEPLLRYHLMSELRHPETCRRFRDAMVGLAAGIMSDLANHVKLNKKKAR